jgi:hypothetical protein
MLLIHLIEVVHNQSLVRAIFLCLLQKLIHLFLLSKRGQKAFRDCTPDTAETKSMFSCWIYSETDLLRAKHFFNTIHEAMNLSFRIRTGNPSAAHSPSSDIALSIDMIAGKVLKTTSKLLDRAVHLVSESVCNAIFPFDMPWTYTTDHEMLKQV